MNPVAPDSPTTGGAGRDEVELCGGCRARGTCRMGVQSWDADSAARTVTCRVVCDASDMAGPGIAHGGWTAGVFDDVLGRLPRALGERAVTGTLTVVYRRPVPVEHDLELHAGIVGSAGRRRMVEGELRLVATGVVLASATAVMVVVDQAHVPQHEQWLAEQTGSAQSPTASAASTRRTT